MNTSTNNPNDSRLVWITILGYLSNGLVFLIGWIIAPNNFSDLIRGGSIGAICLIVLTFIGTVVGIVLFWKAFQKKMMKNPIDILIYSILPLFAGFIFISLIMLVEFNGGKKGKELTDNTLVTYRLNQLQKNITEQIDDAHLLIQDIDYELSIEDTSEEITLLQKEKARLEAVIDRLQLLDPVVTDLASKLKSPPPGISRQDMENQLEKYEDFVRGLNKK